MQSLAIGKKSALPFHTSGLCSVQNHDLRFWASWQDFLTVTCRNTAFTAVITRGWLFTLVLIQPGICDVWNSALCEYEGYDSLGYTKQYHVIWDTIFTKLGLSPTRLCMSLVKISWRDKEYCLLPYTQSFRFISCYVCTAHVNKSHRWLKHLWIVQSEKINILSP